MIGKMLSRAVLAGAVLAFTTVATVAPASAAGGDLVKVCVKILGKKVCVKV